MMKKKLYLVSATLLFLSQIPDARAQVFQNSNRDCQAVDVVSNVGASRFGVSVACKNISSNVDFNGDGFVDCVVLTNSGDSASVDNASILFNAGASATSCAGGASTQFQASQDYAVSGLDVDTDNALSSVVAGNINPTNSPFSDFVGANLSTASRNAASVFSNSSGTFPSSPISSTNTTLFLGTGFQDAFQNYRFPLSNAFTERNTALFDCNQDGNLDEVAVVGDTVNDVFAFNVSVNSGTGLQTVTGADVTDLNVGYLSGRNGDRGSVTVGDFNGDGWTDVAVAMFRVDRTDQVMVCTNNADGTCGFTCPSTSQVILNTSGITRPGVTSIAAGDFNGDGNVDLVVNSTRSAAGIGIDVLFGDGNGNFPNTQFIAYDPDPTGSVQVLTTGCFNNDAREDIAFSYSGGNNVSSVGIVSFDATGTSSNTSLTFTNAAVDPWGIDAADFDNQGGDDILVTASDPNTFQRQAYIFMNTVETIAANAGEDQAIALNTPVNLSGACTVTPADSTAEFEVSWSANGASNVTFTNTDTLTPTFSTSADGTYNLTLTCRTLCGRVVRTDTVTIVAGNGGGGFVTQGGCVGNTLTPAAPSSWVLIYGFLMFVPLTVFTLKKKRNFISKSQVLKSFLVLFVFALAGLSAGKAQALTQSFSTEFFTPAVDDSDYLALYSSPTLKEKNYHFGLWLDYARNPYEICNCSGVRQTGIVDDLLTGQFVGAYGIKDWFEVGGRLPVYFWQGIHAPALGRPDENNIELGDFEADLKFKLFDRDKHHVGFSVVPFLTAPTATKAVHDFTGNGNFTGGAKLVVDGKVFDRLSLAANLGFTGRGTVTDIGGNKIGPSMLMGVGFDVDIIKKQLKIIGETQVQTVFNNFFSNKHTIPAEARLGVRYRFKNGINLNAAGGMAYSNGISNPDYRAIAGITYTSGRMNEFTLKEPAPDTYELKDEDVWAKANVGDELKLRDKIYFDYDKATIRPISKPTLDKLALFLKNHPEFTKVRIEGNTCDLGSNAYNMRLSDRRAMSVDQYLVSQGVPSSRFHVVGNGKTKPIVANEDEAHREQNRRVQIYVEQKQ